MIQTSSRNQSATFAQLGLSGLLLVTTIASACVASHRRAIAFDKGLRHRESISELERAKALEDAAIENAQVDFYGYQSTDYVWHPDSPPDVGNLKTQSGTEPYFDAHGNCVGQVGTDGYSHGIDQPICELYPTK